MVSYRDKCYGRNDEVAEIYRLFQTGKDVLMPGPRRIGKTFVLDRLVEAAADYGYHAVKVEVAGCGDAQVFFRELCSQIGTRRSGGQKTIDWIKQRLWQMLEPRSNHDGPWYQPFINLDYETYFERLIKAMNDDTDTNWAILIDELPIFLKALHDRNLVVEARNFMNMTSRLRAGYPRVRWMITGSIGIEPLARAGEYMGVLAKYYPYELEPLTIEQAMSFIQDLAKEGQLCYRQIITDAEAQALVDAVGWQAAYYLDALSQKLSGSPSEDPIRAKQLVEEAVSRLLQPGEASNFGTWEEHLRKHYRDAERAIAFAVLNTLAKDSQGAGIDALLIAISRPGLTRNELKALLMRLHAEGFLTVTDLDDDCPLAMFRNPLLRRWWHRYPPQLNP
jgi:uncharacterized protein